MEKPFEHTGDPFTFNYDNQQFQAFAELLPSANTYRNYRLAFPNVETIVEGSIHVSETPEGEWLMDKFIAINPVPEKFLHSVSQGFVEFIDTHNTNKSPA